ncbi:MAG: DUF4783 domain-containing protein [Tannerellaceae bacterium]|nr:DUF4783 domain-containing protein [Tannerellaceae bacterium]
MKQFMLIIALIFSFLYTQAADITSISNAFKQGNVTSLSGSFDKEIDIAIPGVNKKSNGAEAQKILSDFFSTNKATGFTVIHHADKKENGFFVGKLPTSSGEYRVNITYRSDGDKAIIQLIRIE